MVRWLPSYFSLRLLHRKIETIRRLVFLGLISFGFYSFSASEKTRQERRVYENHGVAGINVFSLLGFRTYRRRRLRQQLTLR